MNSVSIVQPNRCPDCGEPNQCQADHPEQPCWCMALPLLPRTTPHLDATACYCPRCLKQRINSERSS